MGSPENNRNPLFTAPYYSYNKDCSSIGLCTVYCPQFCYFAFPPPHDDDDSSKPSSPFSPLIIASLVVLSGAFLLVSYYLIVTRYCKRTSLEQADEAHNMNGNSLQPSQSAGLDKTLIRAIAVRKYCKGEGSIDGTECAVCLGEFEEDEPLRLLPKCSHAFHLPCIDAWLESRSSCPLCRAGVVVVLPNDDDDEKKNSEAMVVSFNNNADAYYESRRQADDGGGDHLVLVVNDDRGECDYNEHHVVLSVVNECNDDDDGGGDVNGRSLVLDNHGIEEERDVSEENNVRNEGFESVSKLQRSVSLGAIRSHEKVKNIARVCEDLRVMMNDECGFGIGSSKGYMRMKRFASTGR